MSGTKNPLVDAYLAEGCGRCELANTPECKVFQWIPELNALRSIVLSCGLEEERKWGVPCYTHKGANVAVVAAFKDYCSLSFFKGSLLKDPGKILDKPGENTQSARLIRFNSVSRIQELEPLLRAYIFEAIEVEDAGLKVDFKAKNELEYPDELVAIFAENPALQSAFESLTPGRQRGYLLYFSGAKQSATRTSRIEKYIDHILAGKGFHDR